MLFLEFESCTAHHEKSLEVLVTSRLFCCLETPFSLIFSLIVPQALKALLIHLLRNVSVNV